MSITFRARACGGGIEYISKSRRGLEYILECQKRGQMHFGRSHRLIDDDTLNQIKGEPLTPGSLALGKEFLDAGAGADCSDEEWQN